MPLLAGLGGQCAGAFEAVEQMNTGTFAAREQHGISCRLSSSRLPNTPAARLASGTSGCLGQTWSILRLSHYCPKRPEANWPRRVCDYGLLWLPTCAALTHFVELSISVKA
ncbi:unnamed protein product [Protopolystoma xenopodis]|uniref:Uncharacterized protein n=1 Tax=Protopolystoma xenopodis TaxID=117903 RepID=A0A448XQE3_9PLAT|nr:unnamed protein product [Protopolystoma xenopodis]